jgi:hypothetical protein
VPLEENLRANALAKQTSGYNVQKKLSRTKTMFREVECCTLEESVRLIPLISLTDRLVKNLLRPLFI